MIKKTMKLLAIALIALMFATVPAMAKQLKLVSSFPTAMPIGNIAYPFFLEQVKTISNGEIDFKLYQPGKLVPANAVLDNVSKGIVAAGFTAPSLHAGKIPAAPLFLNIPFGPEQPEKLAWLYNGNGLKLWQELYDNAGYNVKVLPILQLPSESAGWFAKPINQITDFKGLKMRVGGFAGQTLSKVGVSVTYMPMGDVFTALERGVLDAVEYSFPSLDAALGFSKILKINYFPAWHTPSYTTELLINKKVWENKLTQTQRMQIETVAMATVLKSMTVGEATQAQAIKLNASEKGVKNMTLSPEILKGLKAAWLEVVEEQSAKDPAFKKIWDDLSAFRAEYAIWKELISVQDM